MTIARFNTLERVNHKSCECARFAIESGVPVKHSENVRNLWRNF
jgi:hypothetical protein